MAPQSQAELEVSSNATRISTPPSWQLLLQLEPPVGQPRRSTQQHWKLTTGHVGRSEHRLACLRFKKNKTKTQTHNVANLSAAPLTTNIARTEPLTLLSLPRRGPARWVTFPAGHALLTGVPLAFTSFLLHQLASSLREASEEKWQTVRQSYNVRKKKCIWLFFLSFFKISAYKYG